MRSIAPNNPVPQVTATKQARLQSLTIRSLGSRSKALQPSLNKCRSHLSRGAWEGFINDTPPGEFLKHVNEARMAQSLGVGPNSRIWTRIGGDTISAYGGDVNMAYVREKTPASRGDAKETPTMQVIVIFERCWGCACRYMSQCLAMSRRSLTRTLFATANRLDRAGRITWKRCTECMSHMSHIPIPLMSAWAH